MRNILLALFSQSELKSRSLILLCSRMNHKSERQIKVSVLDLQYRPQTRLLRVVYKA